MFSHHTNTHTHMLACTHTHIHTCTHIHMHAHTHKYACIHKYSCTHTHTHTPTHTHHTHKYACTHAHTHTHTHTHLSHCQSNVFKQVISSITTETASNHTSPWSSAWLSADTSRHVRTLLSYRSHPARSASSPHWLQDIRC